MSLNVSRRKSRRKFDHLAKNLDDLIFTPSTSSVGNKRSESYNKKYEQSRRSKSRKEDDYTYSSCFSVSSTSTAAAAVISKRGGSFRVKARKPIVEDDNDLDLECISFRLGQIIYAMDDLGNWSSSMKKCSEWRDSTKELHGRNKKMAQENNMLRVKNELLSDMIARKTLRKEKIALELERLRQLLSTSSSRFTVGSSTSSTTKK